MIRVTSYAEAERYLLGTIDEIASPRTSYKLDRMFAFLSELDDPHRAYPTIHVGGTSGKGSTSTMIAAALQAAGRRTGLHTKPHLHSMTERAQIDGRAIPEERFAALLDAMMPAIERTATLYGRPTYYETLLALAFVHFAQERVEIAVIEVGLGGRLDGTNVITPLVAAITSIGYDHTDVLGETLEAIALEKAGIAKPGVPLVLAEVAPGAAATIARHAREAGSRLVNVGEVVHLETDDVTSAQEQAFSAHSARGWYRLEMPVLGIFQRANAATAIAVIEELGEELRPSIEQVVRAFAQLRIPGRMEIVARNPSVVFDIAHNAEKAESLVASLRERFAGRRVHYVVAIGETKDARRILEILAEPSATFTFTNFTARGRRSIPPQRLAAIAESLGMWGRTISDPAEALSVARRRAEIDDVVVVTGSTFVVAGLREWYAATIV
ncbi:MAG TPA: folylpolyglutamate synthase/dihydrofolate synthase family protein [Candidatus Cybelea sp.]|jgi:dihydrofolate synthase/folylpolyglutamate synthase|nr:folylpolyglutamate synthase/dihydrofolate synthase family protein [Candidatus Cybelea sp.]